MIEFDRFHRALHADGGLAAEGVHLSDAIRADLRGHDAYAHAWFENWTRDGQPATGAAATPVPYPTSPDVDVTAFEATGYATTGDDAGTPAPDAATPASVPPPAVKWVADHASPEARRPGWYPSPTSSTDVQWWDGSAWTAERRPIAPPRRGLARFVRR